MDFKASDWNVVIVGRWNPAILTPGGIKKFVFKMEEADKVEVAVPLDGLSPYLVKHPEKNITVIIDVNRLLIKLENEDYQSLCYAMEAGVNALESLPQTPFIAAGFNVRFNAGESPTEILDICTSTIDAKMGELGHTISARGISRTINYGDGNLNININHINNKSEVLFNFHRNSNKKDELVSWLKTDVIAIQTEVEKIINKLNIKIEELVNENDGQ